MLVIVARLVRGLASTHPFPPSARDVAPAAWCGQNLCLRHGSKFRSHLGHDREALLNFCDLLKVPRVLGLVESADHVLYCSAVVKPLLKKRLGGDFLWLCHWHGFHRSLAAGGGLLFRDIGLPLAALGGLRSGSGRRGATGTTVIIVNALHVVPEVPLAGETITGHSTLAAVVHAKERLVTMAMQSVGLTLVTKEASGGGESSSLTGISLAAVGLEMRIHEFAGKVSCGGTYGIVGGSRLTRNCT